MPRKNMFPMLVGLLLSMSTAVTAQDRTVTITEGVNLETVERAGRSLGDIDPEALTAFESTLEAARSGDSEAVQAPLDRLQAIFVDIDPQARARFNDTLAANIPIDGLSCSSGCVVTNCSVDCGENAIPQCDCGVAGLFGSCNCLAIPGGN